MPPSTDEAGPAKQPSRGTVQHTSATTEFTLIFVAPGSREHVFETDLQVDRAFASASADELPKPKTKVRSDVGVNAAQGSA